MPASACSLDSLENTIAPDELEGDTLRSIRTIGCYGRDISDRARSERGEGDNEGYRSTTHSRASVSLNAPSVSL